MKVERWREKIVNVEVMDFNGWPDVDALFKWSEGKVYFVPPGEEHALRPDRERTGGQSVVLHDAPAFLVVSSSNGDVRANIGDVIIKQIDDKDVFPMEREEFFRKYEKRNN